MTQEITTLFCNVLLPVPIPKLFTYRVPAEFNDHVQVLQRTIVPFGPKKVLTGVIQEIHQNPPQDYEAKMLLDLLDPIPILFPHQLELITWMANYYMCAAGEVLNAALPSGLKLSSESLVQINPAFDFDNPGYDFSEKEWSLLHRLKHDTLSYTDVAKFLGVKHIYSLLKSLASKNSILLLEEVKEKYQPKKIKHVRFAKEYVVKKKLEELFRSIASKPKQEAVLLKVLQELPVFQHPEWNDKGIPKNKIVVQDISEAALRTLIKQKVLEEYDLNVPRFHEYEAQPEAPPILSEIQTQASNNILEFFQQDKPVLLHGVTGSGKTEIYIDLIKKAIDSNAQALLLLPEIALTTQIVGRLKKIFGNQLGVYHSRFSDNERVEIWNGIVEGKLKCVVGVRSSIFLPFDNLGLIIVDEEHDTSYKQDRPPRYHARNAGLMLAKIHHAKILLGSATPSVETYFHATRGTYGMVTVPTRFAEAPMPQVKLLNIAEARKNKSIRGSFTAAMINGMEAALKKKEQVILFQNRRGYSPFIECEDCGYVPKCINCSVSLTYHQFKHSLLCHYCGYVDELPKACPSCSGKKLLTMGLGTEKLEEEVKLIFPDAGVQRMDLDTTRSKAGYSNIIESFEQGKTDILIGTQMVTKGLDFDRVNLVGVFDADRILHFPDFRSYERAFQLITQVSGRAGRRKVQGQVLIQTHNPNHPVFGFVMAHDVAAFLENQIKDRENNFYPPFSRLIQITVKHADKKICFEAAKWMANQTNQIQNTRTLGPAEPAVSKIRNEFLQNILLKIPRNYGQLSSIKAELLKIESKLLADAGLRAVKIIFDVDPN
jgi:primosomal protein N' (replication factor Y) (superfamily II helicase)